MRKRGDDLRMGADDAMALGEVHGDVGKVGLLKASVIDGHRQRRPVLCTQTRQPVRHYPRLVQRQLICLVG